MSYDVPGFRRSYVAGADLSAQQYRFVKLSGTQVVAAAAATDPVIGVLENKPTSGLAATVMVSGVVKVICGDATITAGVKVYLKADGSVTTTVASNFCVGVAETAGATGKVMAVLLRPLGACN